MQTMTGTGALKSYMASGSFYKPEVVLDNVSRSQQTDDGVIEFKTRDISGRIGISKNSIITGGVVDGTGETGISAVCKLLLIPYGDYTFRRAVPVDKLHLEQDLNLRFDEAKTFLLGPSSIGLASPSDHVIKNMRTSPATSEFGWETTSFRSTYQTAQSEACVQEYIEAYGSAPQDLTESYVHDCNRLLDAIDKKRQVEIQILNEPRKTYTDLEILNNPGPLPSRKTELEGGIKLNVVWAFMAFLIFVGLAGFSLISKPVQLETIVNDATTAQTEQAPVLQGAQNDPAPQQQQAGTAPYVLPSGQSHSEPPPNPQPVAAAPTDDQNIAAQATPVAAPSYGTGMTPAPAASSAANPELTRCMDNVRRLPADPTARRNLAFAYMQVGDSANAVDQYYQVMKLQKVDATDIIQFTDNLTVFCGRNAAKQFLTDMVRYDPASTSLRQKLSSL